MTQPPGWPWFYRWAPYGLLALGAVVSAVTASFLMSRWEAAIAAVLSLLALSWQLSWDRQLRSSDTGGAPPYFVVRTILAFGLSALNPFFSIFALMGYFDAGLHLRPATRRWGLLAVALTLANAQSSVPHGPIPRTPVQLSIFAALLALHSTLALLLDRFNDQALAERRRQQVTIGQLQQALAEISTLQSQLVIQAREAGRADERALLAADIHDTLAQGLTGIITQLQAALDNPDQLGSRIQVETAITQARHSLREARRSVHELAGTPTPEPLADRIRQVVGRWSAGTATTSRLTITGDLEPVHPEIATALVRITEEALTNVTKHAAATRVGITLSYLDDELTLDIRDDGRGFSPDCVPPVSASGGYGLAAIRSRVERLAGQVAIESEPGGGTTVAVRVPLVSDDD